MDTTRIDDDIDTKKTKLNGNDESKTIFHKMKWEKIRKVRIKI